MFEKAVTITSFDVFPNSTVRPSALLKYMQQIAREDCDAAGCTYPFMREQNTVFVITKLGLDLDRPIRAGEIVTIRTYNNRINGIFFDREYDFFADGEPIGHCSSYWVLVRYDTRALVKPKDFPFEFVSHNIDMSCGRRLRLNHPPRCARHPLFTKEGFTLCNLERIPQAKPVIVKE